MQQGREVVCQYDRAQCDAFLSNNNVESYDVVIICSILISYRMASVLFDPASNYYFVFVRVDFEFDMICALLDAPIDVSIPIR